MSHLTLRMAIMLLQGPQIFILATYVFRMRNLYLVAGKEASRNGFFPRVWNFRTLASSTQRPRLEITEIWVRGGVGMCVGFNTGPDHFNPKSDFTPPPSFS